MSSRDVPIIPLEPVTWRDLSSSVGIIVSAPAKFYPKSDLETQRTTELFEPLLRAMILEVRKDVPASERRERYYSGPPGTGGPFEAVQVVITYALEHTDDLTDLFLRVYGLKEAFKNLLPQQYEALRRRIAAGLIGLRWLSVWKRVIRDSDIELEESGTPILLRPTVEGMCVVLFVQHLQPGESAPEITSVETEASGPSSDRHPAGTETYRVTMRTDKREITLEVSGLGVTKAAGGSSLDPRESNLTQAFLKDPLDMA